MYAVNSLPILLTLPVAFYLHTKTSPENVYTTKDGISFEQTYQQHAITQQMNDEELYALSSFINKMFGEVVNVINISSGSLFDEIPASNYTVPGTSTAILGQQIMTVLLYHMAVTLFGAFLINFTLFGVLAKILIKKCCRSCHDFRQNVSQWQLFGLKKFLSDKIFQSVDESDNSCSEKESDSEDSFHECVFFPDKENIVDREESIPKANQSEEKKLRERSRSNQSVVNHILNNDSGIVDIIDPSDTTPNKSRKNNNNQPENSASTAGHTSSILTSTLLGDSSINSPEKFKRFLHERFSEVDRLGITIDGSDLGTIDDSDGYLDENETEDDDITHVAHHHGNRSLFATLNDTFWEQITLLA